MQHDADAQQIIAMVNDIFAESFEIDRERLKPEANLFADLGLDSLDAVDLIVALQQKFGVKMRNDERVRAIRTLHDLYTLILAVKQEQDAAKP